LLDAKGHLLASAGMIDPQALVAAYGTNASNATGWTTHHIGTHDYLLSNLVVGYGNTDTELSKLGELVVAQAVPPEDAGDETASASLGISSTPSDASCTIDGKQLEDVTPVMTHGLSVGMHHVVCQRSGNQAATLDVKLGAGDFRSVTLALPKKAGDDLDELLDGAR